MLKQTIVWTALPNGNDGPLAAGSTLHLSVFVAPRLWNSDPSVSKMKLNAFPDFSDWPALISQATFQVEFDGGPTLNATPENVSLRSDLWQALFKDDTDVVPFVFEDLTGVEILSFPSATIHDVIRGVYQRAATDPVYGAGSDLPGRAILAADPDLRDIARPTQPAEPYVPPEPDRGPVVLDKPEREGCSCLGCLLWPIDLLRRLLKSLGVIAMLPLAALGGPGALRHAAASGGGGNPSVSGGGANPAAASVQKAAFDQLQTYLEPHSTVSAPLPTQAEVHEQYDFHKMVSALGDYPNLLRYTGLVVDLVVTLDANLPPATSTVKVIPTLPLQTTTSYCPRTHYELGDERFLTRPRPTNPEISNGLLRLDDTNLFRVTQVDVAGSGVKLQNMATNFAALEDRQEWPPNSPEDAGLPALRTAGISIVRPELATELQQAFLYAYALNAALAAVDQSPSPPPASSDPPPPPTDELFAEDVVRGYRIDVFDDKSLAWHSLCRRIGTYEFLDAPGGPVTLNDEEDEGFVQIGATEPLDDSGSRTLRTHESLFTWNGWSLCASRPGKTILPDHTIGEAENKAVTQFQLETEFRAKPGSLPRLRYGYSYQLRARVVDLAGNSVINPDDSEFANTPVEVTTEFKSRRFEPVSPPPLVPRAEFKEGESLERLTVRSKFDDPPATIASQSTERHVVPPKTSQLMAELHHKFDSSPGMLKDQAAYDLASREAGSVTHKLNLVTGDLEVIDGVQPVPAPPEDPSYWLQTKGKFEVAYLPDPCARGVLLLGLPGMASFEQIIEPDGQTVNKIPFEGDWPDLKPFRLRLVGLDAGAVLAQPGWNATDRVLTVQLPQGEMAHVRISSYFKAEDLENQAVWQWTREAAPPSLGDLEAQTVAGRSWLHLPYRTLVLVHAVQQPLAIPKIAQLAIHPGKPLGETSATLKGEFGVDAKSTGKVDLRAAWQDPFDDVSKPAFDPSVDLVSQQMHVEETQVEDPANDQVAFQGIRHALGDTKYHKVTYTPIVTTRFRECFPPAITADPQNLIRPTASEVGTPEAIAAQKVLDIPNSARPDAPKPLYVLPTFAWSKTGGAGVITKVRRGGGLRVYLERPWYSSGAGELLGVLLRPEDVSLGTELAETLKKYTSEWGMDPIWSAESTAPITMDDFLNPKEKGHHLSLAELPNVKVRVAGYEPGYDADRNLWYCDIGMKSSKSYFPFVRLALARFQPISVPGAHLSPVVLADFVQVVPHRTVTYDLTNLTVDSSLQVKVSGPSYFFPERELFGTPLMVAGLQQRQFEHLDDELGWEAISGEFLKPTSQSAEETVWEGTITVPQPLPDPLRVVVLEMELFLADQQWVPIEFVKMMSREEVPGTAAATATHLDKPAQGYRIVFADAIVIP